MRLHPITQLMLLGALMIFAGLGFWFVDFGKAALGAGPGILDIGWAGRIQVFAGGEAPAIKRFAMGVGVLAFAFWVEALARILALLQHHNRQSGKA